jgi:hypothetical protein
MANRGHDGWVRRYLKMLYLALASAILLDPDVLV